jgi:hypothetical protein
MNRRKLKKRNKAIINKWFKLLDPRFKKKITYKDWYYGYEGIASKLVFNITNRIRFGIELLGDSIYFYYDYEGNIDKFRFNRSENVVDLTNLKPNKKMFNSIVAKALFDLENFDEEHDVNYFWNKEQNNLKKVIKIEEKLIRRIREIDGVECVDVILDCYPKINNNSLHRINNNYYRSGYYKIEIVGEEEKLDEIFEKTFKIKEELYGNKEIDFYESKYYYFNVSMFYY